MTQNTTNLPAKKPEDIPLLPMSMQEGLMKILPASMSPERFFTIVLSAWNKTPALRECNRNTVLLAIRQAAELGLEPNSLLGHGYLIPYGKNCTFVPGYKGYVYKAKKCAGITVWADVVYEGEEFNFQRGTDPRIHHKPSFTVQRTDDKIIASYAVARSPDGQSQFEVLPREDVEKIRAGSQGKNSFGWKDHFPEMAKKTAVRRLAKYLPIDNAEWAKLMEVDNENDGLEVRPPHVRTTRPLDIGTPEPEPVAQEEPGASQP